MITPRPLIPMLVLLELMLSTGMAVTRGAAQSLPLSAGTWEGVIEDPRRPTVITIDFAGRELSLSGGNPLTLTVATAARDAGVEFQVSIGTQIFRFSGVRTGGRIDGKLSTGATELPFWLEVLAVLRPAASRGDRWRQDFDVVLTRFLKYDRSFSEAARTQTRARLEDLKASAEHLPDQAIVVELARAIALSDNAHTRLYLLRNRTEVRRWPIRVWWFGKELRVVRAGAEHRAALGCRLTRIGSSSIAKAFRAISNIKPGNASWQRYMTSYFLTSPDILFGARVIPDPERTEVAVKCGAAKHHLQLVPQPLVRSSTPIEAWWDLAPSYPHRDSTFTSALSRAVPRYLRHPTRNYWFERIPEDTVLYLQYNRAQEMAGTPMRDFIDGVRRAILDQRPRALIVDVRFNTGGDAGVGTPLVDTLVPLLRGVPVVVLTSRATFSAGITHVAQWKQNADATIIGERVGDRLDMWSEGGNLVLPNSRLTVHYANGFHGYSEKDYPERRPYFADLKVSSLEPDVVIEPRWDEYLEGRDPVLEAALARARRLKR